MPIQNASLKEFEDIEKEDTSCLENITQPFSPNDIRLNTPPMNMGDIIDMIQYKYINFDADYQREQNLWNDTQQSRLIESVLLGLRLPAFYFEEVSKKNWRIIDGLQRCCSIRNFCVDGTLRLKNLEFLSDFEDKTYEELPFDVKRDIRMLPVTVNVLEKGAPDKVKYVLFKRLNTGGITLNPQEIRNAIFIGKAIDTVKEMAEDEWFIKATNNSVPTIRRQDQDFISRFISFYLEGYKNYVPDLDNFINNVMEGINNGKYDSEIDKMKANFRRAMILATDIFGKNAFRRMESHEDKKRPINKAYFEVISVCFARMSPEDENLIRADKDVFVQNLMTVMHNDKTYNNAFSSGTANRDSVFQRFAKFEEIMDYSKKGTVIGTEELLNLKLL